MGYQRDLLESVREVIAGRSHRGRQGRNEILRRLESVCIEAREQGNLDFFLEIRAVIAAPSQNWAVWLKTSSFRADVGKVVRRHGLSVFMVALLQLEAVLAARQSAGLPAAKAQPALDQVPG